MSVDVLINAAPGETRVALLQAGVLQEIHMQRASRHGLVGNIYLGRVQRVLPGMQAAFVEIGLQRAGFLHASDIIYPGHEQATDAARIEQQLQQDDHILVQITKEPLGSKGARLTMDLSIPSRYLVLMPYSTRIALSVRIEDCDERQRLEDCIEMARSERGITRGFIARTSARNIDPDTLATDVEFLDELWASLEKRIATVQPETLVHSDLPLALRMLRDLNMEDVEHIHVDDENVYQEMQNLGKTLAPDLTGQLCHFDGDGPIFDLYGVNDELDRSLQPRVLLKSGGSLVIEQTEAMTTVDVNTGGYVGGQDLEDTIVKTNLEAAKTIARQLRLRNLGGIIIIDFIDMDDEEHRRQVLRTLDRALADDPAKTSLCEISSLGLVEMTRKRNRESLEHLLCEPCPTCQGRGQVKTVETVCHEIFRELSRSARQHDTANRLVLASPDVTAVLVDELADALTALSRSLCISVKLQAESLYHQEQFDVIQA